MTPRFRKTLRWLIAILAVLLALAATAVLCRDPLLKLAAVKRIEKITGMRVEMARLKTGLRDPAIAMQGLRLYNYPEFGGTPLAVVPDLLVEFDADQAAQGRLRFKRFQLNLAELNVVRDAAGRWNLDKLGKEMTDRNNLHANRAAPRLEFGGIDELRLTIGRVQFTDFQRSGRTQVFVANIRDQVVTGLRTEDDLLDWIGSNIFNVIVQERTKPGVRRKGRPVETLKEALER